MDEGWTYVDVRSAGEFDQGHPSGAVNIPLLNGGPGGLVPNPDFVQQMKARFPQASKLVIGCQAGGRSAKAVGLLASEGYTNLVDQRCGFGGSRGPDGTPEPGWAASGLPVETGPSK